MCWGNGFACLGHMYVRNYLNMCKGTCHDIDENGNMCPYACYDINGEGIYVMLWFYILICLLYIFNIWINCAKYLCLF